MASPASSAASPSVRMNGSLTLRPATAHHGLSSSLNGLVPGNGYANLVDLPGADRLIALEREFREQVGKTQEALAADAARVAQTTALFFHNSQNSALLCIFLSHFSNLTSLVFENDSMGTFPRDVEIKKLTAFSITKSPAFQVISICHLNTLTFLDLSENGLKELPPEIGLLTLLRIFRCAQNRLDALPSELAKCRELEELDISSNEISDIPKEIYKLPKLKSINAKYNGLGAKPKGEETTGGERKISIPGKAEVVTLLYSPNLRPAKKKEAPVQGATVATPPRSTPVSPLLSLGLQTLASLRQPQSASSVSASASPLEVPRRAATAVSPPARASSPPPVVVADYSKDEVLFSPYKLPDWDQFKAAGHLTRVVFNSYQGDSSRLREVSLPHLTRLEWYGGALFDVALVCHFLALQTLTLRNLSLSSLPSEIAQLTELTELNLERNVFSSVPSVILQLEKLSRLNFEGNKFPSFPQEVLKSKTLISLNLKFNPLPKESIPQGEELRPGSRKVPKEEDGRTVLVFY